MLQSDDFVASLARGIDTLRSLSSADGPLTLAQVATKSGATRATARRLLLTLEHLGYVATDGPTFWLRPGAMELGDLYLANLTIPVAARPHLAQLANTVHDTCSLTVLDGDDVVYVERVKATRLMNVSIDVGSRFPAFIMSSGRVLLGELSELELQQYLERLEETDTLSSFTTMSADDVAEAIGRARADGFAIADQELDPTVRSIAVPVRDNTGRAVAAVNVSTSSSRTAMHELKDRILPELLATSEAIADAISDSEVQRQT